MFYQEEIQNILRFGDVLKGYISTHPKIKQPFSIKEFEGFNYNIDVDMPNYSVVLTPCCSIGEHTLSLTPLIELRSSIMKNSNFVKDFTIINRPMESERRIPPDKWKKLSEDEKQRQREEKKSYVLLSLFIYEKHDLFPKYTLKGKEINYYMIDFRNTFKLNCEMIKAQDGKQQEFNQITKSKFLQLSIEARSQLRDKLSYYYGREPEEDKIQED